MNQIQPKAQEIIDATDLTEAAAESEGPLSNLVVDWKKIEKLRVTQKIANALGNLEMPGLYLYPTNRRKDARKKYLGFGTKKMMSDAQVPFLLNRQNAVVELLSKNLDAITKYHEFCVDLAEQTKLQREPVTKEDPYGLIQMCVGVYAQEEFVGVFRCGGFISGKADDLTVAKISEKLSFLTKNRADAEREVRKTTFCSSEKIAVITNLLMMLADEVGSYINEMNKESLMDVDTGKYNFHGLITKSPMILDIIRQIKLIGTSDSSVIIYGESGTGKERIANLIHEHSNRSKMPFVTINCAALTETILEAELFGYKKGAFTGATSDKMGLFEAADKGIIFLDEVGEMSLSLQVKILRLIQEGTFMRVGDTVSRKVDVQVISATHRDLRQLIELGKFREDLYYRLAVVELTLPPLRDRPDDVQMLSTHFLHEFEKKTGKSGITFSSEVIKIFQEYYWPGNVREIRNEIERVVALMQSHTMVKPTDLSKKFFYESYPEGVEVKDEEEEGFIKTMVDDFERNLLSKYLRKHKWNKTKVAKLCGITRQGLNKKIVKYKLDRRRM